MPLKTANQQQSRLPAPKSSMLPKMSKIALPMANKRTIDDSDKDASSNKRRKLSDETPPVTSKYENSYMYSLSVVYTRYDVCVWPRFALHVFCFVFCLFVCRLVAGRKPSVRAVTANVRSVPLKAKPLTTKTATAASKRNGHTSSRPLLRSSSHDSLSKKATGTGTE